MLQELVATRGNRLTDDGTARTGAYAAINDYAMIGDGRCAALISKEGSLDWLCLPRFDSPSVFAALLDARRGGCFRIRPSGDFQVERCYVGATNVLATTFKTATGVLRLTDLMPIYSREDRRHELCPERHVLRRVECLAGEVTVEIIYEPRLDYARVTPHLRNRHALGLFCAHGGHALVLRSEVPLALTPDNAGVHGYITLRRGERRFLSLAFTQGEPAIIPATGQAAEAKMASTLRWWED